MVNYGRLEGNIDHDENYFVILSQKYFFLHPHNALKPFDRGHIRFKVKVGSVA